MAKWKCRNKRMGIWSWKKYSTHITTEGEYLLYRGKDCLNCYHSLARAKAWGELDEGVRNKKRKPFWKDKGDGVYHHGKYRLYQNLGGTYSVHHKKRYLGGYFPSPNSAEIWARIDKHERKE